MPLHLDTIKQFLIQYSDRIHYKIKKIIAFKHTHILQSCHCKFSHLEYNFMQQFHIEVLINYSKFEYAH